MPDVAPTAKLLQPVNMLAELAAELIVAVFSEGIVVKDAQPLKMLPIFVTFAVLNDGTDVRLVHD